MNELHEAASVHTTAARGVRCHRCGVHYEAIEWQCLPLSQRLEASEPPPGERELGGGGGGEGGDGLSAPRIVLREPGDSPLR